MTVTYPYTSLDQCSPLRYLCIKLLYIKSFSPITCHSFSFWGGAHPLLHMSTTMAHPLDLPLVSMHIILPQFKRIFIHYLYGEKTLMEGKFSESDNITLLARQNLTNYSSSIVCTLVYLITNCYTYCAMLFIYYSRLCNN